MTGLASMTCFARSTGTGSRGTLVWEIKAVNNKGLDIRLRLPPGLDAQDIVCRNLIAATVARGSVQATLTLQRAASTPQVRVDGALLRSLVDTVMTATPPGVTVAPPTMDGLLAVRGVVEIVEPSETPDEHSALVAETIAALKAALVDLDLARKTEGAALGRVLGEQLAAVTGLVDAADSAPGRTPAAIEARLARSIDALTSASSILDPERLHQEAIMIAARADIREELDRLSIHAASASDLLRAGGPVGRRLDFLAQELGREANTLCAKSNDAGLTAIGLDLRNRIEQFREQVQNLE